MKKDHDHTYTLTLIVHNNPGVLVRCAQIFNRRSHNIEALQMANTSNDVARMTITAFGNPATINQITLQLKKLIDVIDVTKKELQMSTTYGPYSPTRTASNLLFISGQVGVDPTTKTAETDIVDQTQQALENMKNLLLVEGLSLQSVVKTTVFLTNMDNFSKMNAVYEEVFSTPRPARSTLAVRELPRVAGDTSILVEIEAIASVETA